MNVNAILADLEANHHDERVRKVIDLGVKSRTNARIRAALLKLEQGDWYSRHLAVVAIGGSEDCEAALRLSKDASISIAAKARKQLARFGADEQIVQTLDALPLRLRRGFLQTLRKRDRLTAIDAFLRGEAKENPERAAAFIPFASAKLLRKLAHVGTSLGGSPFWKRLIRVHPRIAADLFVEEANRWPSPDPVIFRTACAILPLLGERRPDDAIRVMHVVDGHGRFPAIALASLVRRRPRILAQWLLNKVDPPDVDLSTVVERLNQDDRLALLARHPKLLPSPEKWLRKLPPQERVELFATMGVVWRNQEGVVDIAMVSSLPRDVRVPEAKRHLELSSLAARPSEKIQYAGLLPWSEACDVIGDWLRHPDAELRIAAIRAIFRVGRYDPSQLLKLIEIARKRANEQDPVRAAIMTAIADLPPSRWMPEHLTELKAILQDALNAADLSWATVAQMQRFAVAVLPRHARWAIDAIVRIAADRGGLYFGNLEQRWSDSHVQALAPSLEPVLVDWFRRTNLGSILAFAGSLGRRLKAFPGLVTLLEKSLTVGWSKWQASSALQILVRFYPERRAELIPKLLEKDASWITASPVWAYLHRRRQDLLTEFLPARAYRGRFSTGGALFVLPIQGGFHRWTGTQHALFAKTLERAITLDRKRATPHNLATIRQIARLPCDVTPILISLYGEKRAALAEAAIRATSRLDVPRTGLEELLRLMHDDRGRVAIYTLRRILSLLGDDEAGKHLMSLPMTKVTIAKEVLRLLGELPTKSALPALKDYDRQPLHRDVRIALLRALWGHLEEESAWTIIFQSIEHPDPALVSGVVRIPDDRLSDRSRGRLLELLVRLLDHPEPMVRRQTLARCADVPVRDSKRLLLKAILPHLISEIREERECAAYAAFVHCREEEAKVFASFVQDHASNRRFLVSLFTGFQHSRQLPKVRLLGVVREILRALDSDPLTQTICVRAAGNVMPIAEFAKWLTPQGQRLTADALMAVVQMAENASDSTEDLVEAEKLLADQKVDTLRRVALALLQAIAKRPPGWDEARKAALSKYQADRSELVASAAQFVFPE
ncbi:MAG: hypothetical protein U0744_10240 [Gemmataceae bacterium]